MTRRAGPLVAALALLAATGLVRRRVDGDPAAARALELAAARLERLPDAIGGWDGHDAEVDRRGLENAGIAAIAARRYQDPRTGAAVTLVVIAGRPGPVAAHGPESCYPGVGFNPVDAPQRVDLPGGRAALWRGEFAGTYQGRPRRLQILWGWSAGGPWSAPESPRLAFAGVPVLWKAYFLRDSDPVAGPGGADVASQFAAVALPELDSRASPAR